jgi:rubrerythrin
MDFTNLSTISSPKRFLNNRELERALRLSICAEHDATQLYESMADSVQDEKLKKLFQDIANEEKVHVGEFEKILQSLDKTDEKLVEKGKDEAAEKTASKKSHPVSEAQRKWAFAAEDRGELPKGKALKWSKRVEGEHLPKHSSLILRESFINELQRIAIIKRQGNGFVLMSHKGKVLGHHPSRESALKQERAIEIHKHGG